jgi:cellulose synthase/poly-beta-1,6-N-acetylglucosamine synthase-like glycosyltransferase
LSQDYPNLKVTLVDDRSQDQTGEIAERIARQDRRLSVLQVQNLPQGWMGKNHAMHQGISAGEGDWLLMTDADCDFSCPRAISAAMAYAVQTGADLLSVLPILATDSFWEHVVQPVCGGVMMIWFHPDKVNNPRKSNAYANGAFMLMPREAYRQIGGHEALADCPNEDLQLARNLKARSKRLVVVRNQGLYSVRMYRRLGQIVRGWTRIFLGAFASWSRLVVSILVLILVSLSPWALAVGSHFAMVSGSAGWTIPACIAWAAAGMQLSVIARFYRLLEANWIFALSYPVGCLVVLGILLRAGWKMLPGATVQWRGGRYSGSAARQRR